MVWIQIIGLRKFCSLDDERKRIFDILTGLNLDLSFLDRTDLISHYDPNRWKLIKNDAIEFFEYRLSEYRTLDSIRIIFNNPNFIEFSGPFHFFSSWYRFAENHFKNTENWQKIFRSFAKEYGIGELLYFSEDFFPLECVHDKTFEFKELFEAISNAANKRNTLAGLDMMHDYYIEKIAGNPSANTR